jgi:hypothetical protein
MDNASIQSHRYAGSCLPRSPACSKKRHKPCGTRCGRPSRKIGRCASGEPHVYESAVYCSGVPRRKTRVSQQMTPLDRTGEMRTRRIWSSTDSPRGRLQSRGSPVLHVPNVSSLKTSDAGHSELPEPSSSAVVEADASSICRSDWSWPQGPSRPKGEQTCGEQVGMSKRSWFQTLLSLLHCESNSAASRASLLSRSAHRHRVSQPHLCKCRWEAVQRRGPAPRRRRAPTLACIPDSSRRRSPSIHADVNVQHPGWKPRTHHVHQARTRYRQDSQASAVSLVWSEG